MYYKNNYKNCSSTLQFYNNSVKDRLISANIGIIPTNS